MDTINLIQNNDRILMNEGHFIQPLEPTIRYFDVPRIVESPNKNKITIEKETDLKLNKKEENIGSSSSNVRNILFLFFILTYKSI